MLQCSLAVISGTGRSGHWRLMSAPPRSQGSARFTSMADCQFWTLPSNMPLGSQAATSGGLERSEHYRPFVFPPKSRLFPCRPAAPHKQLRWRRRRMSAQLASLRHGRRRRSYRTDSLAWLSAPFLAASRSTVSCHRCFIAMTIPICRTFKREPEYQWSRSVV